MASTADLLVRVRADASQAQSALRSLQQNLNGMQGASAKTASGSSSLLSALGLQNTTAAQLAATFFGVQLGLAAIGKAGEAVKETITETIKVAADFQTALVVARNNTTMTAADVDVMRQAILRLG